RPAQVRKAPARPAHPRQPPPAAGGFRRPAPAPRADGPPSGRWPMRETAVDTKPPQPAPTDPPPFGGAFFPVPVDALESPELSLDLYLIHDGHEPVLYRSVGSPYSLGDSATLAA